jgi:hypothetical protein
MSRPRRPSSPPQSHDEAIIRAIYSGDYPVHLGRVLLDMTTARAAARSLKKSNASPSWLAEIIAWRDETEDEFQTLCTAAVTRGDDDFFRTVARGVVALQSYAKDKLAVAQAWDLLVWKGQSAPAIGEVAAVANELTDDYVTASKARDYLRTLGAI